MLRPGNLKIKLLTVGIAGAILVISFVLTHSDIVNLFQVLYGS